MRSNLLASALLIFAATSAAAQETTLPTGQYLSSYGIAKALVDHTFIYQHGILFSASAVYLSSKGDLLAEEIIGRADNFRLGARFVSEYKIEDDNLCLNTVPEGTTTFVCGLIHVIGNGRYSFVPRWNGKDVFAGFIYHLAEGDPSGLVEATDQDKRNKARERAFEAALATIIVAGGAAIIVNALRNGGRGSDGPPIEDKPYNGMEVCKGANPALLPFCVGHTQ